MKFGGDNIALTGYCGAKCCDCEHPCDLDVQIPCSPDCENLQGKIIRIKKCLEDGCEEVKHLFDAIHCADEDIIKKYGETAPYPGLQD